MACSNKCATWACRWSRFVQSNLIPRLRWGQARRISQTTNRKWISYLERRFAFDNKRANLNPFEEGNGHGLKVQFNETHP